MNNRIVDIVMWAVSYLKDNKNFPNDGMNMLAEKGFTDKEISTAFSWISDKMQSYEPNELIMQQIFPSKSFRIFQQYEMEYFTDESYSMIIKMLSIGLIRPQHIDTMLNRATELGMNKITPDMLKTFVASYMFDVPSPDHIGNSYTLSGNENIN